MRDGMDDIIMRQLTLAIDDISTWQKAVDELFVLNKQDEEWPYALQCLIELTMEHGKDRLKSLRADIESNPF